MLQSESNLEELFLNTNINKEQFICSLRRKLAREMSSIIWGNSFKFLSLNENLEKEFNSFRRDNDLMSLLSWNELLLSFTGRTIVCLNKTKTGDYMLSIPNIYFLQGISKSFVKPQAAVIYQRIVLDSKFYIIRSIYTTTYCKNELYGINDNKVQTFGETSGIYKKFQIEPYWRHNLGFVPVVEFTNISAPYTFWQNSNYKELTDWFYGISYENTMWETILNLRRELEMCHSRVFLENADQTTINTFKNKLQSLENTQNDDVLGNYIVSSGMNNKVTVVPGVGDFAKYTKTLNDMLDIYFKMCGSARFSEGGGAQKTYADTSSQYKNRSEYVEYKISLRIEKITELIYKYFRCIGKDEETAQDFIIQLSQNINKDDISYIESQSVLLANNVISPVDWIMNYYNCSKKQAEKIYKVNKKMSDELQQEQMDKMMLKDRTMTNDGKHLNLEKNK